MWDSIRSDPFTQDGKAPGEGGPGSGGILAVRGAVASGKTIAAARQTPLWIEAYFDFFQLSAYNIHRKAGEHKWRKYIQ